MVSSFYRLYIFSVSVLHIMSPVVAYLKSCEYKVKVVRRPLNESNYKDLARDFMMCSRNTNDVLVKPCQDSSA